MGDELPTGNVELHHLTPKNVKVPLVGMLEICVFSYLLEGEHSQAMNRRNYGDILRAAHKEKLLLPNEKCRDHPWQSTETVWYKKVRDSEAFCDLVNMLEGELRDFTAATVGRVIAINRIPEERLDKAGILYTARTLSEGSLTFPDYWVRDLGLMHLVE